MCFYFMWIVDVFFLTLVLTTDGDQSFHWWRGTALRHSPPVNRETMYNHNGLPHSCQERNTYETFSTEFAARGGFCSSGSCIVALCRSTRRKKQNNTNTESVYFLLKSHNKTLLCPGEELRTEIVPPERSPWRCILPSAGGPAPADGTPWTPGHSHPWKTRFLCPAGSETWKVWSMTDGLKVENKLGACKERSGRWCHSFRTDHSKASWFNRDRRFLV